MFNKNVKKIDHLIEDEPIPGQLFVCVSFLSPEGIRNCKVRGLKIRGVYGSKDEADKRAKYLQSTDPDFHVFVGEIGKWLPWDPDPNSATEQEYREEELQKLMEAYKENRKHVKDLEKERKDEMMNNAKVDSKKQETINRLRKKLENKKEQNKEVETKSIESSVVATNTDSAEKMIKEQEELIKTTKSELDKNSNLEDNLDKIAQLYRDIHHK